MLCRKQKEREDILEDEDIRVGCLGESVPITDVFLYITRDSPYSMTCPAGKLFRISGTIDLLAH